MYIDFDDYIFYTGEYILKCLKSILMPIFNTFMATIIQKFKGIMMVCTHNKGWDLLKNRFYEDKQVKNAPEQQYAIF